MTAQDMDARELALALLPTAQKAGAAIMDAYHPSVPVEYKPDNSPVTIADRAAEEIILNDLEKLMPGVPVIAEEQAAAGILPKPGSRFFLVDPVDGTKEFLKGNGEFTVNIALIEGNAPCFGLVYAPAFRQCFVTVGPGAAAQCELLASSRPASPRSIEFEPLGGEPEGDHPLRAIVSRSHIRPQTEALLERLAIRTCLRMGSSFKFCVIARGEADIYPRHGATSEWDIAAGQAILECSGGAVLTFDGNPLTYGKAGRSFINPPFVALRRPELKKLLFESTPGLPT